MNFLKELPTFIKFRIALLSTLSAVTGFVLASVVFSAALLVFTLGMFVLASGSAALNQYQERHRDSLMERTKNRPLPAGRLSPKTGLVIAVIFIVSGLCLLYLSFGAVPAALGLTAVLLYNGLYTYLKRVTAFAAVPGALIGAVPPAIGWTAAGGALASPALVGIMFFFYLWQVPHFWLLLGIHSKDYTKAGFPAMTDVFTTPQLARITFTWVLAAACAGMLFPLFGMFNHVISIILLAGLAVGLALRSLPLLKGRPVFRKVFVSINIFALLVMMILIVDIYASGGSAARTAYKGGSFKQRMQMKLMGSGGNKQMKHIPTEPPHLVTPRSGAPWTPRKAFVLQGSFNGNNWLQILHNESAMQVKSFWKSRNLFSKRFLVAEGNNKIKEQNHEYNK